MIKALKDFASATSLPGYSENTTPIYLLATAGMRTVATENQRIIYRKVLEYLDGHSSFAKKTAKTVSGKTEGVYDWLAVNYQQGNIGAESKKTVGVMDMGGASMQVAYAVDDSSATEVTIANEIKYNVKSRSYLGLGADYVRFQYSDDPHCFPSLFPLSDGAGDGNYSAALADIGKLLDMDVRNMKQVPDIEFYAISAFRSIAKSPQFGPSDSISIKLLSEKGAELANMTWPQMKQKWPNDMFLFSSLFTSAYMIKLLEKLGFAPETEIKVSDATWTIGAAIYELYNDNANLLTSEPEDDDTNLNAYFWYWGKFDFSRFE